jgi:hypothetical protein
MVFTRRLYTLLFVGLQFRTILSRHISYTDKRIQSIDGVHCSPSLVVCSKSVLVPLLSPPSSAQRERQSTRLSSLWIKYLASLS